MEPDFRNDQIWSCYALSVEQDGFEMELFQYPEIPWQYRNRSATAGTKVAEKNAFSTPYGEQLRVSAGFSRTKTSTK